ncbi:MAG: NAD(P)/FAD-dependent oxidoreductase, partial [Chrysiogenetes bacterium]|nr:NAD(P)/FAD-dependent oxidoreductase [Chrysiogenetes bacterium]
RPGGSLSYYEKKGFQVDMGTHLFTRGNKGPLGDCTRRLGMGTPVRFRHTRDTTWFRGMNLDVVMPGSPFRMPPALVKGALQMGIPITEYPNMYRLFRDILSMREPEIERLNHITIDEFMRRYTKNAHVRSLIGFLLGLYFILPTWEASAGESIWCLQRMFNDFNLSYPEGGAVAIPKAFLQGAESHGAEVRMRSGVEKIEVRDGRVVAVRVRGGKRITTKAVVSTTSMKDTVVHLTGRQAFPAGYVQRAEEIKGSMIAVQAKIGLKKRVTKAGSIVGGTPLRLKGFDDELLSQAFEELETGRVPSFTPIYAPVPSNYDPNLAPEGHQLITACSVAPTLDVELTDSPEKWIENMMRTLHEMVPGLEENTIFCDTFTVKNTADWIGKSNGAAVTTGQTPGQVGINRPGHRTPVRGLYLAGDCAGGRGVGTELACQSGMDCGDLLAQDRAAYVI